MNKTIELNNNTKPHYVLKLCIDKDNIEFVNMYQEAIQKNNAVVDRYLYSTGPTYFDAGFDLFCPEKMSIAGRQTGKLDHQVKAAMEFVNGQALAASVNVTVPVPVPATPVGYYLYPRSSTGSKTPLRLANSVGIIDAGYRGHLIAMFDNWQDAAFQVEQGQRLVQICPPNLTYPMYVKLVEAEELGVTERGERGFGSTNLL